jgi:Na+/H+ antiporter NhaD/arsenite permease-like protein
MIAFAANSTLRSAALRLAGASLVLLASPPVWPADLQGGMPVTLGWPAWLAMGVFLIAMIAVTAEELIGMRKSKPILLAAGLIWAIIAYAEMHNGSHGAEAAARHSLLQYAELMLFLLVVMTYINALNERRVFAALRGRVATLGFTYRRLFWTTGLVTFFLSPFLDNLSTALLMGAVVLALSDDNPRFAGLGCVNVVVAANAGGVYSPFGDLTTLIVWQQQLRTSQGALDFWSFFHLLVPALVGYLVTASLMQRALPVGGPSGPIQVVAMRRGARMIIALLLATIATTVAFEAWLYLPPVVGMMTGLSYLQIFGFYLKVTHRPGNGGEDIGLPLPTDGRTPFDVFRGIAKAEWDALFFLYGMALSVGGLAYLGWLSLAGDLMYGQWGPDVANLLIGLYSAAVENIPTMFAVLAMQPDMSLGHWLTVTLTTGTGGSLLSIGSAAGIALMGQSRGTYTFLKHLRWTPAIGAGFVLSLLAHYLLNASLF